MEIRFFRSPDGDETTETTETKGDLALLGFQESAWISSDGGTTNVPFPDAEVEYDFCVYIVNAGTQPSEKFVVKFSLSGESTKELWSEEIETVDPGAKKLVTVHYGAFPNQSQLYRLHATIYSVGGTEYRTDGGLDFNVTTK